MTLAQQFKSLAKNLQPDNDSLQELDDTIDSRDQIYDVMSDKSDFVCGMATVILSLMRWDTPSFTSGVPDFPEDFKAQFLGFGSKGVVVDQENTALIFTSKDELVKGVGLGVICEDQLTFEDVHSFGAGEIIVWWEDGQQFDSGEGVEGILGEMLSKNKKMIFFHELKKN